MTFVVNQSEMDNLRSRLTSVADALAGMGGSTVAGIGGGIPLVGVIIGGITLGSANLSAAVNDFMSDANKRRDGSKKWCEENAEGVRFAAQHAQDTEDEVADAWAKENPSMIGNAFLRLRMLSTGGKFPWDTVFPHDDETYQ